ncbi:hypothetical protein [Streptomyces sp. IBSBF 2435]|uniref:hypothetical protein n=1 Tax=Streptomyces sp. IBSBF 2435 TaxID=2903531 RepID=UPI002FDBE67C
MAIDRGHGNELNIKLAGFAPGAEVTVSVYTDTSASGGPAGQKSVSVKDDGTCEFGAFPMDAHGAYWVVADGVRSNSYQWAGK